MMENSVAEAAFQRLAEFFWFRVFFFVEPVSKAV
jgi:hypothetical protein